MYHAKTVFTGSEIPALLRIGCGVCCADARPAEAISADSDNDKNERFVCIAIFPPRLCCAPPTLELPKQPPESVDTVLDTAAAQRVPYDSLMGGHATHAELAFEGIERTGRRPMGRRKQDRVGAGMLFHQRAAHLDGGMARNAADLVEGRAPTGCAQNLTAEVPWVAGDAFGVLRFIGMRHHHLFAAERFGGGG